MEKASNLLEKNYVSLSVIIIVTVGVIFRFKGLTFDNHWLDELYSADFSNPARSFGDMVKITLDDVHPPLYQTILWLWYRIFGFTEYAGRSLSAVIGTLSIFTFYFLGKVLLNRKVGIYAALIASANIFLIRYSQEVRSYELFLLLSMLSYLQLYKAITTTNMTAVSLYWILTILLFYTHYFSFFIVATQIIFLVIYVMKFSENKKNLMIIAGFTAFVFFVFLLPLIPYILARIDGEVLALHAQPSPLFFVGHIRLHFGSIPAIFVFLGGVIGIKFLFSPKTVQAEKIVLILLVIWGSFGYILPYLKGIFSYPLLSPRYTIALIPPIIIFSSYGISKLRDWKGYLIISFYLIFSLQLLFSNYYGHIKKAQYREVLKEVSEYSLIPIYERIPYNGTGNLTNHFQTYSDLLKLDLDIINDTEFKKDILEENLPECFWVLNAHYTDMTVLPNLPIERSDIIENNSINIAKIIDFGTAEGVLLSYKTPPSRCIDKVSYIPQRDWK